MNVSLYDLLDVDETASTDEIRAAWKAAIADLDPTDRRFRAFNDAAGVLLDDAKRATYDAELAAGRDEETAPAPVAAAEEPTAVPVQPTAVPVEPTAVPVESVVDDAEAEPEVEVEEEPEPAPVLEEGAKDPAPAATATGPSTWLLYLAAGLAVVSAALLVVVLTWPGSLGGDSPASTEDQAAEAETAATTAEDVAADAVPVVLSYDYRTLDQDFAAAEAYLTEEFGAKRTALFAQTAEDGSTLTDQIVEDKVVVTARVSGTGLTRVSEDGKRATVVVFVDQDSQRGTEAPRSLRMWATLDMVLSGGDWLLDDICTEDDCG